MASPQSKKRHLTRRVLIALTAGAVWLGLLLQAPLTLANCRALGMSTAAGIVTYFSFFTILTNFLTAIALTVSWFFPHTSWGRFFLRPGVNAAVAVYIGFVGLAYSLLLRHVWDPEGLQKIADILLHDAVPLLYVVSWVAFLPKARLLWRTAFLWLGYPLAYLVFALLRGALVQRYPYYFIDVTKLGYARVLGHAVYLLCGFLALSFLVIAVSRWLSHGSSEPGNVPENASAV